VLAGEARKAHRAFVDNVTKKPSKLAASDVPPALRKAKAGQLGLRRLDAHHTSTRQEETKKLRLLGTLRKLERLKQAL